jgi:hypothetical protein
VALAIDRGKLRAGCTVEFLVEVKEKVGGAEVTREVNLNVATIVGLETSSTFDFRFPVTTNEPPLYLKLPSHSIYSHPQPHSLS